MERTLVDVFCPVKERIVKIVGKRIIGVSDTDRAALGMFDSRVGSGDVTTLYANVSWNEMNEIVKGHVFSSGGAPNMYSMLAQYPAITDLMKKEPEKIYAFTLEDMVASVKQQPSTPPLRWIYDEPVAELLKRHGGKFSGISVHFSGGAEEVTLKNYLMMRFLPDVSNIGKTQEYTERNIIVPRWRLEATDVIPNEKQKPVGLETQDAPFVEGWDPFLILGGVNIINPKYNMLVFVGGRGPSTFAAELAAIGKNTVSPADLNDARIQPLTEIKLPEKPYKISGVDAFTSEVYKELQANLSSRYGTDFKGNWNNVAIAGMAHFNNGLPLRITTPLDVRFYNKA
ncbi:MAG: hypothetical protein V1702_02405 [Candidatus Woesearchaeota archaeon]